MLESLVTSKTRLKLILKFFLNPDNKAYLRSLADELNESTNAVRVELNRLTEAGFLKAANSGRTILYQANTEHSLYSELHSIVKKYLGIDMLIEQIINHLGKVGYAFVTGDYAKGIDSGIIDLVIVGEVDKNYLNFLIEKAESLISRKIRVLVLNQSEYETLKARYNPENSLVLWEEQGSSLGNCRD